jgi:outer membrane protein OmpA-like peptidoglycan-associated protein
MAMPRTKSLLAATSMLALLTGCNMLPLYSAEPGVPAEATPYGASVNNNAAIQSGEKSYVVNLQERFNREVPDTINFAFDSDRLDAQARAILDRQADWINQFPEVRFRVYGHTDLVGSTAYNKGLGMRRARAVVAYLGSRGVSRSRLEAVVSYGETRPVIDTQNRERRNRRTVTEVTGFVADAPLVLNGKYAEVAHREYIEGATWQAHPDGVSNFSLSGGSNSGG